MYEHYKYGLPLNLASGDRLYWLSTGAYTTSYSAVEFNGFPPLKASTSSAVASATKSPASAGFFMSLWKPRGARVSLVRQPMTRTPT